MASKESGKDITDPARGIPETRGGENPSEWTGPLPETPQPPNDATPPGSAVTIAPGSPAQPDE